MTRGNQRELARERAKKQGGQAKSAADHDANQGLTLEQRKARDAELMRLKQQKALDKKGGAGNSATATGN